LYTYIPVLVPILVFGQGQAQMVPFLFLWRMVHIVPAQGTIGLHSLACPRLKM